MNIKYIDLSWAIIGISENAERSFSSLCEKWNDESEAAEHYVIGYLAFWHIAFIDEAQLLPCNDGNLRKKARRKMERFIAEHPPVKTFPRFYIVMLRQQIVPMGADGISRVYQV